jgi:antitoxin component YwqK of YwqJK toxin-antitoxin module
MKTLSICSLFVLFSLQVSSQDVVLLMASHYTDTDQSFGGKYLGFHNSTVAPYVVDSQGRISGRHLTFYENGNIETLGNYRLGIKHGLWVSYNSDGKVLSQAYYTDGRKDGAWKVWDANGTLRCEMFYKNGKRVKTWKFYDETGALTASETY